MTRAEFLTSCLAGGWRRPECDALAADRMVDGVFCDGTIVLDANGSRCVSRSTLDRVAAARAADPLVRVAAPDDAPARGLVVAGVIVGMAAFAVWFASRRD